MRKSWVSLGVAALATLLAQGTVRADSVPWGYSAADTQIYNDPSVKTSSITFTGSSGVATGDSGIIIYNLTTSSSASGTADTFSNTPFSLGVTLTDVNATSSSSADKVASDTVNFSGLFNATNVTKSSLLPGPTSWTTPTEAQVTLGSSDSGWRTYTVDITSFTPPGQPGGAPGSILATVHIADAAGPPAGTPPAGGGDTPPPPAGGGDTPPNDAPEPSTLLLAGLGLPIVLAARRRLKKTPEVEAVA